MVLSRVLNFNLLFSGVVGKINQLRPGHNTKFLQHHDCLYCTAGSQGGKESRAVKKGHAEMGARKRKAADAGSLSSMKKQLTEARAAKHAKAEQSDQKPTHLAGKTVQTLNTGWRLPSNCSLKIISFFPNKSSLSGT